MRKGIKKEVFLDNSSVTKPSETAISKMLPFLTEYWGTPSAPHQKGQELFPAITESLRSIYSLLEADDADDFIYTSSSAEGVNQVVFSTYLNETLVHGKNHFITTHLDEAPAMMTIGRMDKLGCVGTLLHGTAQGYVTQQDLIEAISPRTALVSISWANGLTGVVQPVAEIAKICHLRGIALHLDATHVLGKLYFDLKELQPSFITFDGDRIHGPQGTGGLYIRSGQKCSPLITGGIEQAGLRAGPMNVAGCVALGIAAKEAKETRDLLATETARLRDRLERGVLENVSESQVFFADQERVPHISAMAFPGVANEALLYALNRKGVYASIGGGSFQQIGYLLKACKVPDLLGNTALSFSLSRETSDEDIDRTVEVIVESVKALRKVSYSLQG